MNARLLLALGLALLASTSWAAAPAPLLVANVSQTSPSEQLLAVSLQGLANRDPAGPRVFLLTQARDGDWLQECLRLRPRPVENVTVAQLLARLKPELKGQLLYDPEQPFTVNLATTAAGLYQAAISAADLGLPTLLDLRHRWSSEREAYRWAQASLPKSMTITVTARMQATIPNLLR